MTSDGKHPRRKPIDEELEDDFDLMAEEAEGPLKHDEEELERIEEQVRKAMKTLDDGHKWPDQ